MKSHSIRLIPKTLKDYQPSFALSLAIDYSSSACINGKKFYPTKANLCTQSGVLIIHPGAVQWIGESFYDFESFI